MRFLLKHATARRPIFWAAIYICVLLLLFILGVIESRVDEEGMGFFPLLVLTTPWSWLFTGLWDFPFWGGGLQGKQFAIFVTCNVISGALNGSILYLLVDRRQKRSDRISRRPGVKR